MAFKDPRSCLLDFFQTGRNLGRRPPSFSLRDVKRDIRAVKTRLENIKDRVEGAIGAATRGEFLPGQFLSITNEFRCPPTPYASYLSQFMPPKLKFLFFASMKINPDFIDAFGGTEWANGELWWFIKQAGRPSIAYEWEETNRYNFRTKALKYSRFEPIAIQMYDDIKDVSHSFWNTFIRLSVPVSNLGEINDIFIEDKGMEWTDPTSFLYDTTQIRSLNGPLPISDTLKYSASSGILPGLNHFNNIIEEIQIHHILNWGRDIVTYTYRNPRILDIRMDDLSWESPDINIIDVMFEFDVFDISYPNQFTEEDTSSNIMPPVYPISPQFEETPIKIINQGLKTFNTAVNRATTAVGRAVQTTVKRTLNQGLSRLPRLPRIPR